MATMATKTSTVLICFLACLLLFKVEGQVGHSKGRCLCLAGVVKHKIRPELIEKMEVFSVSNSCPHMEIIITLKNGAGQRCLSPEAQLAKKALQKFMKSQRNVQ